MVYLQPDYSQTTIPQFYSGIPMGGHYRRYNEWEYKDRYKLPAWEFHVELTKPKYRLLKKIYYYLLYVMVNVLRVFIRIRNPLYSFYN